MKKWMLVLVAALLLALPCVCLADEVSVAWKDGSKAVDLNALKDGDDATGVDLRSGKNAELTADLGQGVSVQTVFVRMDSVPVQVDLQYLNANRKWETIASSTNPGCEVTLTADWAVTGRLRLYFTYASGSVTRLKELRSFSTDEVPEELHQWRQSAQVDVLLTLDRIDQLDASQVSAWASAEKNMGAAVLVTPKEGALAFSDALWNAGFRVSPLYGGMAENNKTGDAALKAWGDKKVTATLASWLRHYQPMMVVDGGEVTALRLEKANASACNPGYELADAAEWGLWSVPQTISGQNASDAVAALGERDDSAVRQACLAPFASATHGDPATIPYPANRDAEGYLPEGEPEFVLEDPDNGLWAYLSQTVQVEIVRYDWVDPDGEQQRFFVSDVHFKPEYEKFQQQVYVNATFKGQQIWPKTLAQTSKMVIAINGDYYPYRKDKGSPIGNILRNYQALYDLDKKKNPTFPNLDTVALRDDGSLTVYDRHEITATELAAQGDVHDALSFGPYLARDGRLRIYDGKNAEGKEPRSSIGMVSPGHYILVQCEGRMPNKGPRGLTVNQLGMILYGHGVTDSIMLDGGSTTVLCFMGEYLMKTGKDTTIGSPRNQHELFGVGTSELVHTDWVNGKPKK